MRACNAMAWNRMQWSGMYCRNVYMYVHMYVSEYVHVSVFNVYLDFIGYPSFVFSRQVGVRFGVVQFRLVHTMNSLHVCTPSWQAARPTLFGNVMSQVLRSIGASRISNHGSPSRRVVPSAGDTQAKCSAAGPCSAAGEACCRGHGCISVVSVNWA